VGRSSGLSEAMLSHDPDIGMRPLPQFPQLRQTGLSGSTAVCGGANEGELPYL
jgi:hypothetical protein